MNTDIDKLQTQQFKVEWQLPVALQLDPDLNDEESEEMGETFYGDNLVVKISVLNHVFEVARRFLICSTKDSIKVHPEEGWHWNEHGDLTVLEQDIFEFIIKKCPECFIPPEAFKEKLKSML